MRTTIEPKFFHFIPEELEDGILYISLEYGAALHKCCCGCGETVSTPIDPNPPHNGWTLTNDSGRGFFESIYWQLPIAVQDALFHSRKPSCVVLMKEEETIDRISYIVISWVANKYFGHPLLPKVGVEDMIRMRSPSVPIRLLICPMT